jgi:sugar phosphate isomerase/epimerase
MFEIGFHTDAFNSAYWSFDDALAWAQRNNVRYIEPGAIAGVSWIHGLGYQPHIALWEDPYEVRRKMEDRNVQFSQIDAAFPLSHREGISLGVRYVVETIHWAHLAGCNRIDTTDDRKPTPGLSDEQALDQLKRAYDQILEVATRYNTSINVEPHGYYTTKPEFMEQILDFFDSPLFGLNMDTGNTYIAGQDPVAFAERFADRINHVHIKDVSESLAAASRGELTGIAVSHTAIGDGVNAENIRKVLGILERIGYSGVLSLECEGEAGPMIEKSLAWVQAEIGATANA